MNKNNEDTLEETGNHGLIFNSITNSFSVNGLTLMCNYAISIETINI